MSDGYRFLSAYYDLFTENIDYKKRAEYFHQLALSYGNGGNLLLDLACGTGKLSVCLADLGYDVIGVDGSSSMLSEAMGKPHENILYLHQSMEKLDLYGTVDVVVCALDSLNHVISLKKIDQIFQRIALFLNDDGVFLFDVNSVYKQEKILADNTFVYETEEAYLVWQNTYAPAYHITTIALDFFLKNPDGTYIRRKDGFAERAYTPEEWKTSLEKAGLKVVEILADDTLLPPNADSQRLIYVVQKIKDTRTSPC